MENANENNSVREIAKIYTKRRNAKDILENTKKVVKINRKKYFQNEFWAEVLILMRSIRK